VKGNYHVIDCKRKGAERTLAAFCRANGQILLPLVELVEQARLALDTVVEQVSQQTIETILQLSAEQIAGPRTPGRSRGEIRWYGSQAGRVSLADRQLSVRKPRLRRREKGRGGEVGVPAYQALQKNSAMVRGCLKPCCEEFPHASTEVYCRGWPKPWGYRNLRSAKRRSKRARHS
jgi:hypothetical protein